MIALAFFFYVLSVKLIPLARFAHYPNGRVPLQLRFLLEAISTMYMSLHRSAPLVQWTFQRTP